MNHDQLQNVLSYISDRHIAEAAAKAKRRYTPWVVTVAACLAVIIGLGIVLPRLPVKHPKPVIIEAPVPTQPTTSPSIFVPAQIEVLPLAEVHYPKTVSFPLDQSNYAVWETEYEKWLLNNRELHDAPDGYAHNLTSFWGQSTQTFLSSANGENMLYSPLSLYMALSILAQTTSGETQQEILTLLSADSMDALSQQAKLIFENHYQNDGVHTSILANSLWLDDMFEFRQDAIDKIAKQFYASVYQGALESPEMNIALRDWLSKQTGGLLDDSIAVLDPMDIRTALAIVSTINYSCKWDSTFSAAQNSQDIFHGAKDTHTVTYMNKTLPYGNYYCGETYTATYLPLDDGSRMWIILPNEDTTAEAVLQSGKAIDMIFGEDNSADSMPLQINLSIPKFDISADLDLMEGLQKLGIHKAMDYDLADFTGISANPDNHIWLEKAQQGIRVAIDEDGLTGVAYTILVAPGDGMPSTEEVDFVLNRPFLFVVESGDGLPLFTGIVNQP